MPNPKELLVLQHVPHEHPGFLSNLARENGISLRIVKLWKRYTIVNNRYYRTKVKAYPFTLPIGLKEATGSEIPAWERAVTTS